MAAFLTADEIHRVTGKRRFKAQRRALDRLGIRYAVAASGEPIVRPDAVDDQGRPAQSPRSGHRWDRIGPAVIPIRR